jgi:asparagine synthase (glutamine-hydrolysing)
MSGIFGLVTPNPEAVASTLQRMAARLAVTPFVTSHYSCPAPGIGIGAATLGYFEWERRAPVQSPDGTIALWLVGEFFHTGVSARRQGVQQGESADQARFALAVYMADGLDGLAALSGTFQIAIWHRATEELVLINDRVGFYPHYYCHRGGTFVFAPSLRSLLAVPEVPREPDDAAIAQFLRFQQILGSRSWLRDVSLIPPATQLRVSLKDGKLTAARYWDWDQLHPDERITRRQALEGCTELFQSAVDARIDPERSALLLSGGLDSRAILAFAREPARQMTVTFGAPGSLDVALAGRIAASAGSRHEWDPYADGHWVRRNTGEYLDLTEAAQSVIHAHGLSTTRSLRGRAAVILTGWGGGTIPGGYLDSYEWDARYRAAPNEDVLVRLFYEAFCLRLTWPGLTDDEEARLLSSPAGAHLRRLAFDTFVDEFRATRHYDPAVRLDAFYIEQHERRGTLYMHVVARGYVEARAPYKDDAFQTYFFSIPESIRRSPWLIRAMLHRRAPALARIPYERDGLPPHPSATVRTLAKVMRRAGRVWRRVRGLEPPTRLYADYEHYVRTDLRPWMEALLFSDSLLSRGWFDGRALRQLWERHLSGMELWTIGKIMPIVTIEQAMRYLFDDATHPGVVGHDQRSDPWGTHTPGST